ncbi:heat-inducible transcriptional repressor [Desulfobaculum xiamenense]|uniref:Heat-inducible transcription repressor HrcA n=1 Tax=Desulfobaculum xiamenense TaxID=995050 RepID=A0A846QWF6_9BACT|nr:heat-inducible transcriptional repressor HrcA [Desulfobaculum xiamenense]NJB69444.1 heat-inducible transcriptional repressor [Desulfobaculum xiamenense]
MPLSTRETTVLTTIVEDYISKAQPLGSRHVARRCGLGLSAASIRNTMADLTDKGFLEQPHTSAGRIPTPLAFRLYLDTVLTPPEITPQERAVIRTGLDNAGLELDDILRQCSRLLATLSQQVSMVLAPAHADVRWRSLDFVPVRKGLVMAVLVMEGDMVEHRLVSVENHVTRDDLTAFSNFLNHHYAGMTLTEARAHILVDLEYAQRRLDRLYHQALRLARDTFEPGAKRDFFFDGTAHVLTQPEFANAETMRQLLHMLEERSRLLDLLDGTIDAGRTTITFARHDAPEGANPYGLISAPFGAADESKGALGIIGPLRMDYARILPVVDFTARMLTELLSNR